MFAVGAAKGICTKDNADSILLSPVINTTHRVTKLPVLPSSRAPPAVMRASRAHPSSSEAWLVNENAVFTFLVLTAARFGAEVLEGTRRADTTHRCVLAMLRGHEGSVLRLITDFAGVVPGRQLRNAREAVRVMPA